MRKQFKSLVVIILVVCFLNLSILPPRRANAEVFTLTTIGIVKIGAALIAAGWSFANREQLINAAGNIYHNGSQEFRNAVNQATVTTVGLSGSWFVPLTGISRTFKSQLQAGTPVQTIARANATGQPVEIVLSQNETRQILNLEEWYQSAAVGQQLTVYISIRATADALINFRNSTGTQHTNTTSFSTGTNVYVHHRLIYTITSNGTMTRQHFRHDGTQNLGTVNVGTRMILGVQNEMTQNRTLQYYISAHVGLPKDYVLTSADVGALNGLVEDTTAQQRGEQKKIGWPWPPSVSADTALDSLVGKTYDDLVTDNVIQQDFPAGGGTGTIDLSTTNGLLQGMKNILQGIWDGISSIPAKVQGIWNTLTGIPDAIAQKFDKLLNPTYPTTIDTATPTNAITDKIQLNPLSNTLQKLQNFNTSRGQPPKFEINLNALVGAGSAIHGLSTGGFSQQQYTLVDFQILENYSYAGLTLIELIRVILSFGMLYLTLMYVWREVKGVAGSNG